MGGTLPIFLRQDNPASFSESFQTRYGIELKINKSLGLYTAFLLLLRQSVIVE